jgi:hypothetical protein
VAHSDHAVDHDVLHEEADPDFVSLVYVGVVGTFLLVAICLMVVFLVRQYETQLIHEKTQVEQMGAQQRALAEQEWRISYDHKDPKTNELTAIPVEEAAKLLIAEQRQSGQQ